MPEEFEVSGQLAKYDASLGLVLGWAIVCKQDGRPYFDLQDDHIPEQEMLAKSVDFMLRSRISDVMHDDGKDGTVVFAFPMTEEVKKAFQIECPITGLMVAVRPSGEMLQKCQSGEFTGFSIGGKRDHSTEQVVDITKYEPKRDDQGRFAETAGSGAQSGKPVAPTLRETSPGNFEVKVGDRYIGNVSSWERQGRIVWRHSRSEKNVFASRAAAVQRLVEAANKVEKYNHNHDSAGRFAASGGRGGSGGARQITWKGSRFKGFQGTTKEGKRFEITFQRSSGYGGMYVVTRNGRPLTSAINAKNAKLVAEEYAR